MKKRLLKIIAISFLALIGSYVFLCFYLHVSLTAIFPVYASKGEWQYKSNDTQLHLFVDMDTDNYANGICHVVQNNTEKQYDMRLNYNSCTTGGMTIWERDAGASIEESYPHTGNILYGGLFKVRLNKDIIFDDINSEGGMWDNKDVMEFKKIK